MKLTKQETKIQAELLNIINADKELTNDDRWMIYEEFHPGSIGNITVSAAFFTPIYLAQDVALFTPKYEHMIDCCAGIGTLAFRCLEIDYHEGKIESLTHIELNPEYLRIAERLLKGMKNCEGKEYDISFIQGNVFDEKLWESFPDLKSCERPGSKFSTMVSNPPYGKLANLKADGIGSWLNYKGELELMVLELCLRFADNGYFILPPMSCPFQNSGRPYHEERPSRKFDSFIKANKDLIENRCKGIYFSCDGIDTSLYIDEWK